MNLVFQDAGLRTRAVSCTRVDLLNEQLVIRKHPQRRVLAVRPPVLHGCSSTAESSSMDLVFKPKPTTRLIRAALCRRTT